MESVDFGISIRKSIMGSLKMGIKMGWACILLRMVIGIKGNLSMGKLKGWVFNI